MKDRNERGAAFSSRVAAEAKRGWNTGKHRAIVLEWKEHIADQLSCGYTWKVVWRALKEMGIITMSYNSFRLHCRAAGLERADGRGEVSKQKPKNELEQRMERHLSQQLQRPRVDREVTLPKGKFVHPNDVDLSKYYKKKSEAEDKGR